MKKHPLLLILIISTVLSLQSFSLLGAPTNAITAINIEIDRARIIEDRDYGSAEIYLKTIIDGGSSTYTSIYSGINDGDTLQLNWMVVEAAELSSFTIRVEVWESDSGYDEGQNDYLGHVQYTRSSVTTTEGWYDAAGSIGGNNNLQAQVYIIETAGVTTTATTTTLPSTSTTSSSTPVTTTTSSTEGDNGVEMLILLAVFTAILASAGIGVIYFRNQERRKKTREKPRYGTSRGGTTERAVITERMGAITPQQDRFLKLQKIINRTSSIELPRLCNLLGFSDENQLLEWLYDLPEGWEFNVDGSTVRFGTGVSDAIDELLGKYSEWDRGGKTG